MKKLRCIISPCFTHYTTLLSTNGTTVTVGTRDYGFTVPKAIVGKRIIIEGIDPAKLISEKKTVKKEYQKDIQFAATGIRIFN